MEAKPRLLRITTVPISLKLLLNGQFTFFTNQGFDVLVVSADGPEVDDLIREGIVHKSAPLTRKITPITDLLCLIRLIFIIRKFKPDIVHTHTPKAGLLGMLASWCCGVRIRIHTVAGLPWTESRGLKRKLLELTEQITYRCAHRVYPNSKALMKFIDSQFHAQASKMKVLGEGSSNGIDINFFSRSPSLEERATVIRNTYGIPEKSLVFCFVGRVVRDKGIHELVEAFDKLSAKMSAYLFLVGPYENELDPLSYECQETIRKNKRIINTGFQTDVRPFLVASDIFVFPSYREGFPNVVLQACALEVPCIVSDINGCNEIITHGHSGRIVKPKDAGSLYEAMIGMASGPEERKSIAIKAHTYVVSHFDRQLIWSTLLNEYRSLLEQREG